MVGCMTSKQAMTSVEFISLIYVKQTKYYVKRYVITQTGGATIIVIFYHNHKYLNGISFLISVLQLTLTLKGLSFKSGVLKNL